MGFIEQTVAFFISLSLFLSPADDTIKQKIASDPPQIYVIPYQDFHNTFCGCSCSLGGIYVGDFKHDNTTNKTIFLAGFDYDSGYFGADGSQMIHELEHYKQDLEGKLTNNQTEQQRAQLETEAYEVQNQYNQLFGLPLINVDMWAKASTNWASGKTECLNGETPLPFKQRKSPNQLINEHQK